MGLTGVEFEADTPMYGVGEVGCDLGCTFVSAFCRSCQQVGKLNALPKSLDPGLVSGVGRLISDKFGKEEGPPICVSLKSPFAKVIGAGDCPKFIEFPSDELNASCPQSAPEVERETLAVGSLGLRTTAQFGGVVDVIFLHTLFGCFLLLGRYL